MKFTFRVLTMSVVFAGLAAASLPPANSQVVPSAVSVAMADPGPFGLPIPVCGPGMPGCPPGCTIDGCPQ